MSGGWVEPDDLRITTERLTLTPLVPDDADEMVGVLGDVRLHEFIGGEPPDRTQLHGRFEQMVAGPAGADERWLNWVVRLRDDEQAVGTVQATLSRANRTWNAEVAWVVGVPWQGQGIATDAAVALVDWLRDRGIGRVSANIAPGHRASEIVAGRAGLHPTTAEVDTERVWELGA